MSLTRIRTAQIRGDYIFNEDGEDFDFRIEGDTDENLFFVNAGDDTVIIGNSSGSGKLTIDGNADEIQLLVQAHSTQTTNILEVQDSSAAVLAGFDERGVLFCDGGLDPLSVFIGDGAGNIAAAANSLYNIGIGYQTTSALTSGHGNTAIGIQVGLVATSADWNVFIGASAGIAVTTGDRNVFLGAYAGGKQTNNSNLLIIDDRTRADVATELTNSIIYGVMAAAPADQTLRLNASVGIGLTPTAKLHLPAGTAAASTAPLKFTAGTALGTPETGAMEFNDGRFFITNVDHQRAIDRTSDVAVSTVTGSNTTDETTLWTGVMDANSLVAGNVFKFHADGIVSNDSANANDEITIRIKVGGVTKVTLSPDTKALTDVMWHLDANATQRTIGASGSRAIHVHLVIGDPISTGDEVSLIGVADIDTTANMNVTVTAQWASAKATNIISLYQGFMEYKN